MDLGFVKRITAPVHGWGVRVRRHVAAERVVAEGFEVAVGAAEIGGGAIHDGFGLNGSELLDEDRIEE